MIPFKSALVGLGTATALAMGMCAAAFPVSANSISSLQQQYATLQQQQQQLQQQAAQQQSAAQNAQEQINSVNAEIATTKQQMDILQMQLQGLDTQIQQKQTDMTETQSEVDQNMALLKSQLRAMYMDGGDTFLTVLFNSSNVSDFLNRLEIVRVISSHDNQVISALQGEEKQLQADRQALEQEESGVLQTQGSMAAKQDILNGQLAEQTQAMAQAQSNVQAAKQQAFTVSAQAVQTDAQINAAIALEAQQAAQAAAAKKAQEAAMQTSVSSTAGTTAQLSAAGFATASYLVTYAQGYTGFPYVMDTAGPNTFDCSGFVQWVYAHAAGISLPHSAAEQSTMGTAVALSAIQPGDCVFFDVSGSGVDHVGIYIGNGEMVNAENPSAGVKDDGIFSSYWQPKIAGVRRFLS